jgi:hypothetical protein
VLAVLVVAFAVFVLVVFVFALRLCFDRVCVCCVSCFRCLRLLCVGVDRGCVCFAFAAFVLCVVAVRVLCVRVYHAPHSMACPRRCVCFVFVFLCVFIADMHTLEYL